jgi:ectoine hydroxylase-related dioxygenase (phytanoyl-CoA dioxygenase family)
MAAHVNLEELDRLGYTVCKNLLDADTATTLRDHMDRLILTEQQVKNTGEPVERKTVHGLRHPIQGE